MSSITSDNTLDEQTLESETESKVIVKKILSPITGKIVLDIRKYYKPNGKLIATHKGIQLNLDQWVLAIPIIERMLGDDNGKSIDISKP
ncbi:MAG: transcriptional coactivator p15/PC4 family protein [Nanoarchaeota archaeon]